MNKKKIPRIEDEIDHILRFMANHEPDKEEYSVATRNLKELYEARSKKKASFIEAAEVLVVVASIFELLAVLRHEEINVITSKAFQMVLGLKKFL